MAIPGQNRLGAHTSLKTELILSFESYKMRLIRLAVALGVLGAAVLLGFAAAKKSPMFALAAAVIPLALIGLDATLKHPHLTPLFILIAAAFVPFSLPTGTESRLVISLVVTMLFATAWLLKMLVERRVHLEPSPVNRPLLGFILITLVSLAWSNIFRDPLVPIWRTFLIVQVASTIVMIMLPSAFLLVANYINDLKWLKVMTIVILVAGTLGLIKQYGRLSGFPVNTSGLFAMWIIALSISLAVFDRSLSRARRLLLLILAGAWIVYGFILHISWLAGWLPGFVAFGVICFMRSKKLFLTLLLVLVIFVAANSSYYLETVVGNETAESGQTRLAAWEFNWQVTSKHLLFGTGPAGYAVYYMYYFPQNATATHSNYIDILAQTGILGFGLCVWFFFSLAWLGYKLCLRLKGRGDFLEGLAIAALAGTVGCIVAMGFGDWLFPFAYTQTIAGFDYAVYNWLFMGTILVVDRFTAPKPGVTPRA